MLLRASQPTATGLLAEQFRGKASFHSQFGTLDAFSLELTGLPMPPTGQAYLSWLQSADGKQTAGAGALSINSDGIASLVWTSPSKENLLATYTQVTITLEPAEGRASPSGAPVATGVISQELANRTVSLFTRNRLEPPTPGGIGLFQGLEEQLGLAMGRLQKATEAAAIGSLQGMRAHLEPAVNILAGESRTVDADGDGTVNAPGDGFGARGYASRITALTPGDAGQQVESQTVKLADGMLDLLKAGNTDGAGAKLTELKTAGEDLIYLVIPAARRAAEETVTFMMKAEF